VKSGKAKARAKKTNKIKTKVNKSEHLNQPTDAKKEPKLRQIKTRTNENLKIRFI